MDKKFMQKTTFSEICKMIKSGDGTDRDCIKSIIDVGIVFLPALICPAVELATNIATGLDLMAVKGAICNVGDNLKKFIAREKPADFLSRYERAQAAQVLLVFSAYFDTFNLYLPDESRTIAISETEKITVTEESLSKYGEWISEQSKNNNARVPQSIMDYQLDFRAPLESKQQFESRLKKFYEILNEQFVEFINKLSFVEKLSEPEMDQLMASIRQIPQKSVENYYKQYYELQVTDQDFRVWAGIKEHDEIRESIDVGFELLSSKIDAYIAATSRERGSQTLENYVRLYESYISNELVKTTEIDTSRSNEVVFPLKKDIFVPQKFKSIKYKGGFSIENENTWLYVEERDDIGEFVSDTLRHSSTGKLPLLILGVPGAGKTLLCHMLAAKILSHEYHVIIIRLRDIHAENTIIQQINEQIENDFANQCKWDEIENNTSNTPILLIFDGYDELLQASGKTFADYVSRIVEFQKLEWNTKGIQVKCILTSRITLIDKVLIPEGTTIIKLSKFDQERIDKWTTIWNKTNASFFEEHKLQSFSIDPGSKAYELAEQPLLLLLLALYDSNDNALRQDAELTGAQLYDRLIKSFIEREQRKDQKFLRCSKEDQVKIINNEFKRVSVAALGMYNRKALYIRGEELERDLIYLLPELCKMKNQDNEHGRVSDSEKVLGSFFFIHRSESQKDNIQSEMRSHAYEFLHNTFGEFLAAYYIVSELCEKIGCISLMMEKDMMSSWSLEPTKKWFVCLSYAPLVSRPNVVKMIKEYVYDYFDSKSIDETQVSSAMGYILRTEISRVISGECIAALEKVISENGNPFERNGSITHLAYYSLNLLILGSLLSEKAEDAITYSSETWDKLICLWRYAFQESELFSFSKLFTTKITETDKSGKVCCLVYCPDEDQYSNVIIRLEKIAHALGDTQSEVLISTIMGDGDPDVVLRVLEKKGMEELQRKYLRNRVLSLLKNQKFFGDDYIKTELLEYSKRCLEAGDVQGVFDSFILIDYLIKKQKICLSEGELDFFIYGLKDYLNRRIFRFSYREGGVEIIDQTIKLFSSILEHVIRNEDYAYRLIRGIKYLHGDDIIACCVLNTVIKKAIANNYENKFKTWLLENYEIVHIIQEHIRGTEFDESYVRFLFMEFVTNYLQFVGIQKIKSNGAFMRMIFEYYQNVSRRFLEHYMYHYQYNDKYQIGMFTKETISMIHFLKIAKALHYDRIVEDMHGFLLHINPVEIYDYSPEAAYDLCCLVTNDLKCNGILRNGFRRIYYVKNRDLPVKLYWKLRDLFGNSGKVARPSQKNGTV